MRVLSFTSFDLLPGCIKLELIKLLQMILQSLLNFETNLFYIDIGSIAKEKCGAIKY